MIEADRAARPLGAFRVSTFMFALTALALFWDIPIARNIALVVNAGCWLLIATGARRDLRELRLAPMRFEVGNAATDRVTSPGSGSGPAHTGMYRGGY